MELVAPDWTPDQLAWLAEHGPWTVSAAGIDVTIHADGRMVAEVPTALAADIRASAAGWVDAEIRRAGT